MKKKMYCRILSVFCFVVVCSLNALAGTENGLSVGTTGFPVVNNGTATDIVINTDERDVVNIAAEALAGDIELLTDVRPQVCIDGEPKGRIVIGTIGTSPIIDGLIANGTLTDSGVRGQWETFCLTTVNIDNVPTLFIYGSDPRGTAFGVFELSRAMGVTPYVWWADVVPEHRDQLFVQTQGKVVGPPSVKYRGMFINDEDWGLQPWAAKNMDKDVQDIGPRTYEKVCELLLRLKGNFLWPAMHPCTKAFWYYKENPIVAHRYDIVLGASHCEPLLRNNVDEWKNNFQSEYGHAPGAWNWKTNSAEITQYWRDRVIESKDNDAVYTIGMRGIHDSGMPGYSTNSEKQAALKEVIGVQRELLSTGLGRNASEVPQLFCPYKEALKLYRMGLNLPEDVTLLWADDNFGYVRQLSNPEEQQRSGGGGVYYHFSYWGVPYDHLWLSSVSPTLTSYELRKAYDLNCKNLWVFNVGDIKPQEAEFQFAMDYAWDVERWSPQQAYSYTEAWAEEYFGHNLAPQIAAVKNEYYRLAASGKPEHIHAISFSRAEVEQRLRDYEALLDAVQSLRGLVPARLSDAFFQLVYYPVAAACEMNRKVLYAKMSYFAADDGNQPLITTYATKAMAAYENIVSLTREYNQTVSGGKWNGIMDYAPRGLSYFYEPKVQTASNVNMTPSAPDNSTQVVKITAGDFVSQGNSANMKTIEGLGISDRSVTVLPLNMTAYTATNITSAPYVEYDVPMGAGSNTITVKCLPTFPIYSGYDLRYAISIGGATPVFHSLKMEAEASPWSTYVMKGYSMASDTYTSDKEQMVKVRIYMADPGIVLSEVEVKKPSATGTVDGLVNPGFEYKSEGILNNGAVTRGDPWGWNRTGSLNGNSYGINSDATGYEGTSICWYNSTPMPDVFELYQTIDNLEAGRYIVRCKLGVFTDQVTNQRLFANNSVQYYGAESNYVSNIVEGEEYTFAGHAFGAKNGSKGRLYEMAVYVTIAEGESLKVGIRSSNKLSNGSTATNNAGWFKVDDFRIEHADEEAPKPILTDDTYTSMLVNPSFELTAADTPYESGTMRGDPYGWTRTGTLSGNSWGINADGTGIEGNALCWYNANTGTFPEAFQLSQNVSGMPAGHYRLTGKMACFSGLLTNQRLFANKYATYYGRKEDYSQNLAEGELATFADNTPKSSSLLKPVVLDFWLFPDETLTLGVRSSNLLADGTSTSGNNNAGWFKIDDFRIEQVSTDKQDFVAHVSDLVAKAGQMQAETMPTTVRQALANAQTAGQAITADSDMSTIQTTTNALIDAIAAARLAIARYQPICKLVEEADARALLLDASYDKASYEAVLGPIRTAIDNGTLDTTTDHATAIKTALVAAIKSQTNPGADMTEALIADATSMKGWQTTGTDKWQLNTWSTEGNRDGSNMRTPFIEYWVNKSEAKPLADGTITTTIDGLHAGIYRITALVRAYREYGGTGAFEGAYLIAGTSHISALTGKACTTGSATGIAGTCEALVSLSEPGSITFGIAVERANFNWIAAKDFTLTYVGNSININEQQTTSTPVVENVDVHLTRTLSADYWNTLCLPFSLTAEQIAASKLANAAIRQYTSENDNTIIFTTATEIVAGKPYLIKPAVTVENPSFTNVSITASEGTTDGSELTFTGLLCQKNYTDLGTNPAYLATDSTVQKLCSGTLKGMQAYFNVPDDRNVKIYIEGENTDIRNIDANNHTVNKCYNLSGQQMLIEQLQKGIYVRKGKKFIIK